MKNKVSGRILGFTMVGIAICSFTPILSRPIFLIFLGLLAIAQISNLSNSSGYHRNPRLVMCVFLYLFLCIIYLLLGISDTSVAVIRNVIFFILILIMLSLPDKLTERQSRCIWSIIIIVVSLNIMDNIRLCLLYPELYFSVNRGMYASGIMGVQINIGGSRFYNAIYFFLTVCFFCFLNCNRKVTRYLILGVVVLSSVFIFAFCLKASVIVFAVMSIVLLSFAKRAKSFRKFVMQMLVPSLIVYILVTIYADLIIELLFDLFSSNRLAQRLALLVDSDSADAVRGASTVNARENLWMMSINTWLDNPINFIFGIGDHRVNWAAGQDAAEVGIGQHSDFFDSLARYGMIGLILLTVILRISFKYLMSLFDKEYHLQLSTIIILFVIFGFTKGVFTPDIGCALFVLLPLSMILVNKKRNELI